MRLTVGPLPPAVYWRRRAVVLGAALLFVLVLAYSCAGSGTATPQATQSPKPSQIPLTPESGAPSSSEAPAPAPPTAAAASEPDGPSPDGGTCSDAEMSVKPVPSQTSAKRGETIEIRLKIKNISDRTCKRDVGADMQELYIKLGAKKVWSSDTCSTVRDSDVQSFTAGFEREYGLAWNGRDVTRCANGVAAGPYPEPGEYQIFGRLGTKHSAPVRFTITG